jgi:hypothetical protein
MKYIKFTHVDSVTGISVASEPAANGPAFPGVEGLAFEWARESAYPTNVPHFFGTCPDASITQIDGVMAVLTKSEYDAARAAEMRARVPQVVDMRQARLALLDADLLDDVAAALAAITNEKERRTAQVEWEYSTTVRRTSLWISSLAGGLGLNDDQLDALFAAASKK